MNHRKAIIAESRTIDAKHLQLMLSRKGWEAEMVNNSIDLLNKLATNKYNLVMLSDNLPDAKVTEITNKVKKVASNGENLPVVALVNFTIETEKKKLLTAGADFCITKPVYNNSLSDILSQVIEQGKISMA